MPNPLITQHARMRFRERVADISDQAIDHALSCRGVLTAISLGARYVRLGTGQRVVIQGQTIVTVLPADAKPWRLKFDREGRNV